MNWAQAIPILGVVVGWFLNEVSGAAKQRHQEKQELAQAVSELLYLHSHLGQLYDQMQVYKRAEDSSVDYEKRRQWVVERYGMSAEKFNDSMSRVIDRVSKFSPVSAYRLTSLKEKHVFFQTKLTLDGISRDPKFYHTSLLQIEAAYLLLLEGLRRELLKIAFAHSLFTRLRVGKALAKQEKAQRSVYSQGDKIFSQIFQTDKNGN